MARAFSASWGEPTWFGSAEKRLNQSRRSLVLRAASNRCSRARSASALSAVYPSIAGSGSAASRPPACAAGDSPAVGPAQVGMSWIAPAADAHVTMSEAILDFMESARAAALRPVRAILTENVRAALALVVCNDALERSCDGFVPDLPLVDVEPAGEMRIAFERRPPAVIRQLADEGQRRVRERIRGRARQRARHVRHTVMNHA